MLPIDRRRVGGRQALENLEAVLIALEGFAAFGEAGVLFRRFLQEFGGIVAVTSPVGAQAFAEVVDRVEVIVGDQDAAGDGSGADFAEIKGEGEGGRVFARRTRHPGVVRVCCLESLTIYRA